MTNAAKFNEVFRLFASEIWAMREPDFLLWLNEEYNGEKRKNGKWIKGGYCCGEAEWICPKCNASEWRTNRVPFCPWCGNPMEVDK